AAEEARGRGPEAAALRGRLFWDRRGPLALYPHTEFKDELAAHRLPRVSFSGIADDPDHPEALVHQLESTPAGCQWLLDRWAELRALVDSGQSWHSPDKLKAIRLLGKQPLRAADDRRVAAIFVASDELGHQNPEIFPQLRRQLLANQI